MGEDAWPVARSRNSQATLEKARQRCLFIHAHWHGKGSQAWPGDDPDTSYDVVIAGSGFGGGICASQLPHAGVQVLVLKYSYQPRVPLLTVLLHLGRYGFTKKMLAGWALAGTVVFGLIVGLLVLALQVFLQPGHASLGVTARHAAVQATRTSCRGIRGLG
jgi:hypothetical protein